MSIHSAFALSDSQAIGTRAVALPVWRFGAMALPKPLSIKPLAVAVSLAVGGIYADAYAQAVSTLPVVNGTTLTLDGKTATNLQRSGTNVNVTTSTIRGVNAFNSFRRFEVGQVDTVNLRLPNGTSTLINMVYDAPIRIDGVLNSIKDNRIGGNVVFADPFGMVVGRTGVLNVGGLFATSPTSAALLGVIGAQGINDASVTQLLNGALPQAAGSLIRIDGRINALERVRLQAGQVAVSRGATIQVGADAAHALGFQSAVNTQGLQQATGLVERGGVIEIVGSTISVAGTLDASGQMGGGTVNVGRVGGATAESVDVASTAVIKADATVNGNGGVIDVRGNARNNFLGVISARGGAQGGDGGFAEVSANTGLFYNGLVDLRAPMGKTGEILLDPSNVCISTSASAACASGSVTLFSAIDAGLASANFTVSAADTLYVGSSSGTSVTGNLNATANTLTLKGNNIRLQGSTITTKGASIQLSTDTATGLENNGSVEFGSNASINTKGGSIGAKAATINVGSGSVLDTRRSGGTSGNITLTTKGVSPGILVDPDITIDGAKLYADATGVGGKAGAISIELVATNKATINVKGGAILSAIGDDGKVDVKATTSNPINLFGIKSASAAVTIASSTLTAGTINLLAETKIENQALIPTKFGPDGKPQFDDTYWDRYSSNMGAGVLTGFTDLVVPNALATLGEVMGLNFVLSRAATNTNVTVTGSSVLDASKALSISAASTVEAGNGNNFLAKLASVALEDLKQTKFGLGLMYMGTVADTKVSIGSGVTLKGADLTLAANNTAKIEGEIETPNTDNPAADGSKVSLTFGFAHSNLKANVDVASGSSIKSTGDVDLHAVNVGEVSNSSTASTGESGRLATALAITLQSTQAKVNLGTSINDALSIALWSVDKQGTGRTEAKAQAGASPLTRAKANLDALMSAEAPAALLSAAKARKEAEANKGDPAPKPNTDPTRLTGAVAVAIEDHKAETYLQDGITIHARGETDSKGKNTGNQIVIGSWSGGDGPGLTAAASSVSNDASYAKTSVSAAFTYGDYNFGANTVVGNNVTITAGNIGLWSHVGEGYRPNAFDGTLNKDGAWSNFKKVTDNLTLIKDTIGLDFINSSVQAQGTGEEAGYAGAVSVFLNSAKARTEIGSGAKLQQTVNADGKLSEGGWTKEFTVAPAEAGGESDTITFGGASAIAATSDTMTRVIAEAGKLLSTSDKGSGVGVSDAVVVFANSSNVVVREGVTMNSVAESAATDGNGDKTYSNTATGKATGVTLQTVNDNVLVNFAVGAGKSKDTTVVFMGAQNVLTNSSQVRVDDEAKISSASLTVAAADTPTTYAIAGAFAASSSKSAGIAFGLNYIKTDTLAEMANNDTYNVDGTARTSKLSGTTSNFDIGTLSAAAHTGGAQYAVGVAGSYSDVTNDTSKLGKAISDMSKKVNALAGTFNQWMGEGKVGAAPDSKDKDKAFKGWAYSGAGSLAINVDDLGTRVNVDGVSGQAEYLITTATGDSAIVSAAGSAAITISGAKSQSQGSTNLAGAVALSIIGNKAETALKNLSFTGLKDANIMALKGGEDLSIAIGLTVTKGAQDKQSNGYAGVASITLDMPEDWGTLSGPSRNAARVSIANTSLEGTNAGDVNVVAYNSSRIGTGGGAMNAGAKKSIGAAISWADISNDTSVTIDGLTSAKFKNETVLAHSAAQIVSAAVSGSASTAKDSTGINGAIVVNYIGDTTTASVKNSTFGSASGSSIKAVEGVTQSQYEAKINSGAVVPATDVDGADNAYDYNGKTIFTESTVASGNTGSSILAIAGNVSVSTGDKSNNYGASVAVNIISNSTTVTVDKVTNNSGALAATSSSDAYIRTVAAGVSVSQSKSIGGSVAVNVIDNDLASTISGSTARGAKAKSTDGANIDAIAGQVNVSLGKDGSAIGGALSVNVIADSVKSTVSGNTITGGLAGSGSDVTADTSANARIRSLNAAGAVAADASSTTFSGSMGVNVISNSQDALVSTTNLSGMSGTADTLRASTSDTSQIQSLSGSVSVSMGAAYGGAISVNTITNSNKAGISGSSATGVETVGVNATSNDSIDSIAAGVSASKDKLAIAGSAAANTIGIGNSATISSSTLSGGTLGIKAQDSSTVQTLSGTVSASIGKSAFGAAASINTITNGNTASVSGGNLTFTGAASIGTSEAANIKSLAIGAAVSKDTTVEGSLANNVITNDSQLTISNASISSAGMTLTAADGSTIQTLSGAAAVSTGGTAVGAALSVNTLTNDADIDVLHSTLNAGSGALVATADNTSTIKAISASAAVSAGSSASVSVVGANNVTTNGTTVDVLGSSVSGKGITVSAKDKSDIQGINGSVAVGLGGGTTVGGALANNNIINTVRADIDSYTSGTTYNSSINSGSGALQVLAENNSTIKSIAAGVAGSSGIAVAGSVVNNVIANDTRASVRNATGGGTGSATVLGTDSATIETLAGSAALSLGKSAVGVAVAVNTTTDSTTADVSNSSLSFTGGLAKVDAESTSSIKAIAAAGALSTQVSVAPSLTTNTITNTLRAKVDTATLGGVGASVLANDKSTIHSLAGSVSLSVGNAAVGGAGSVNTIVNTTEAVTNAATISAGSGAVTQTATSTGEIKSLAAAGAASANASVAGSVAANTLTNTLGSRATSTKYTGASASVLSTDSALIQTLSGAAALTPGAAAVGFAASANTIKNSNAVAVTGSSFNLTAGLTSNASGTAKIDSIAVALSVAGGGAAVSPSAGVNTITNSTTNSFSTTDVTTNSATSVQASDSSTIRTLTGAAALEFGGGAAIGGAASVNTITNTVAADVTGGTWSVGGGAFSLQAQSTGGIQAIAASAAVSASVGVAGSAATGVIANTTRARFSGATLGNTGGASIKSEDKSKIEVLAGAISVGLGGAGVGAAVTVNGVANKVEALVQSASLSLGSGALVIEAKSTAGIDSVAAAGAGSSGVAVGGSSATNVISNSATSAIDDSTASAGSMAVTITDSSTIRTLSGSAAFAGGAAVGAALSVNTVTNTNAARTRRSGLTVGTAGASFAANTSESISTIAIAGAGSSGLSIAGSVAVNNIGNTTVAEIDGSSVLGGTTGDVSVAASDTATIDSLSGSAAIGGGGSVGVAASANHIGNTVDARIRGVASSGAPSTYRTVTGKTVLVDAKSSSTIRSLAGGIAADATAGVAGSASINVIGTNVHALVDRSADILADGNAVVSAASTDDIYSIAGSAGIGIAAAGVGVAAGVAVVTGETTAVIGGNDVSAVKTKVDGRANAAASTVTTGELTSSQSMTLDNPSSNYLLGSIATNTQSVKGVAVTALAKRHFANGAFSLGGGTVGVAGTFNANAVVAETSALIQDANINQRGGAGTDQDVNVIGASHTYGAGFAGAVGLGAFAGVGAAIEGSGYALTTRARILRSTTSATDDIVVKARATEGLATLDAGASVGLVGVQGTGNIGIMRGKTEAIVYGGTTSANDVSVVAAHDANFGSFVGSVAGGAVGIAGSFGVLVNNHATTARIGASTVVADGETASTTVTATGNTVVDAQSHTTMTQNIVSGTGGGFAFSGAVGVLVLDDSSAAVVNKATVNASAGNLSVSSLVDSVVTQRGGAVAIGLGTGAGAAIGVALARGQSDALISDSTVTANNVSAAATNKQDMDNIAMAGAGGLAYGLAGSVQVSLIGFGSSTTGSKSDSELSAGFASGGAVDKANTFSKADRLGGTSSKDGAVDETNSKQTGFSAGNKDTVNSANKYDFVNNMSTPLANTTRARVINSTLNTTTSVGVNAISETALRNTVGAAGVGGAVGAAAAISVAKVSNLVQADIDSASRLQARTATEPNITVSAVARDKSGNWGGIYTEGRRTVQSRTGAAGGALLGAASASVSVGIIDNTVSANLDAGELASTNVAVAASDSTSGNALATGAQVGAAAFGVAVAVANRSGSVSADFTPTGAYTNSLADNVSVTAEANGTLSTSVKAAQGGVGFAASGNVASTTDSQSVSATIGSAAKFTQSQSLLVQATHKPRLSSDVIGLSVSGGLQVGVSSASVTLSGNTSATVAGAGNYGTGASVVRAQNLGPVAGGANLEADSTAAGGGLLLGANGALSSVTDSSAVTSLWSAGQLPDGDLTVEALRATSQDASGTAVSVGFIGVGAVVASSSATGNTSAKIDGISTAATGRTSNITVNASAGVNSRARAEAGTGGVIAGSAASATNTLTGNTDAAINASSGSAFVRGNNVTISALRRNEFNGSVDTVNASLLGASGAKVSNVIDTTTTAAVGASTNVRVNNFTMTARGVGVKNWWTGAEDGTPNIKSASGGLIDAPAATSTTDYRQTDTVKVNAGAKIEVDFDNGLGGVASVIRLDATSDITLRDKVVMNSGGAIPIATGVSKQEVKRDDSSVFVGAGASLVASRGSIVAGSYVTTDLDARVSVDTYGLAGAPDGTAWAKYTGSNLVTLDTNSLIQANGGVFVAAGMSSAGDLNRFLINSDVHTWNKTAIPIAGGPDAVSGLTSNNVLWVKPTAIVESGGDIDLVALSGTDDVAVYFGANTASKVTSVGIGKDVYRELAAAAVSAVSNAFGGGDVSFDIKKSRVDRSTTGTVQVDGVARVGISRSESLVINEVVTADGQYTEYDQDGKNGIVKDKYTVAPVIASRTSGIGSIVFNPGQEVGADTWKRILWLRQKELDYAGTAEALGYGNERSFLENRLVSQGLATRRTDAAGKVYIDFGRGSTGGQSPKAIAQAQLADMQAQQAGVTTTLATKLAAKTAADTVYTKIGTLATKATGINTEQTNLSALNATLTSKQSTLTTATTNKTNATTTYNAAVTDQAAKQSAYNTANTNCGTCTSGTLFDAKVAAQTALNAANTTLTAATTDKTAKETAYNTALSERDTAQTAVTSKQTAINTLVTAFNTDQSDSSLTGLITPLTLTNYASTVTTANATAFTTSQTAYDTSTRQPAITSYNAFNASATTLASDITNLSNSVSSLSDVPVAGVTVTQLIIPNIAIKLGDIRVRANELKGTSTGSLSAPGDAQVTITNNSSSPIKVQDISIGSTGGNVRLNGFLVDNNADVNKINDVDGAATGASFGTINTRRSGSNLAQIIISNTYNPDNETRENARRPAPDLVLAAGTTIFNPEGLVRVSSEAGSIMSQGNIRAGIVDINAKNGDFVQSYQNGFFNVGADPQYRYQNPSSINPLGIVANGAVLLNARYLNINGKVQSGIADWNVTLDTSTMKATGDASFFGVDANTVLSFRAAYLNNRGSGTVPATGTGSRFTTYTGTGGLSVSYDADTDELYANYADTAAKITSPTGIYRLKAAGTDNIGASYDKTNDRFIVDGTAVKGGYIKLFGQIINTEGPNQLNNGTTTPSGLKVMDGFGNINIVNNTGKKVVVGNLDAGTGAAGLIEISDIRSIDSATGAVTLLNTTYTRDATGHVMTKQWAGTATEPTTYTQGAVGRSATYSPLAGTRYQYTTGQDESTIREYQRVTRNFFNSDSLGVDQWYTGDLIRGPFIQNKYDIPGGQRLITGSALTNYFNSTSTTVSNGAPTMTILRQWSECDVWLCITSRKYTQYRVTTPTKTIFYNTIKSDYDIPISFIGSDSGTISVLSNSDLLLQGALRNINGSTTLNASSGSIKQLNSLASITSKSVVLKASDAVGPDASGGAIRLYSVADVNHPLAGVPDVTVSGYANNGDFAVRQFASNTLLGDISASGKISVYAKGNIGSAGATNVLTAQRVELNSSEGSVGSITGDAPINIKVKTTTDPTLFTNYGVKVNAYGDINLYSQGWTGNSSGEMLVESITSSLGNVRLKSDGKIVDGNPVESIDTRAWNALLSYWNSVQLRGAASLDKQNTMVRAYNNRVNRDYQTYWSIRNLQADPSTYDSAFVYTLSANERAAFAEAGMTTAQINQYQTDKTTEYHSLHTRLTTPNLNVAGSSYNAGFSYAAAVTGTKADGGNVYANTEINQMLGGSSWSDKELGVSLTPGLLKTVTGTNFVLKDPNIRGNKVELFTGTGTGRLLTPLVVNLAQDPSLLTNDQKVALAAAERADLVISGSNVTITQNKPLNLLASNLVAEGLTAGTATSGSIIIASRSNLALNSVMTTGEARIKVLGNLTSGTTGSTPNVSANTGILEAADGAIGTLTAPMRVVSVGTSPAYIARSKNGIFLNSPTGDLNIDTAYSEGVVDLSSSLGNIYAAYGTTDMDVQGKSVNFNAKLNIGSSSKYFDAGVEANQLITAKSTAGSIYLRGASGAAFNMGDITAGGDVSLDGNLGPVIVKSNILATGNVSVVGGEDITFKSGSSVTATTGNLIVAGNNVLVESTANLKAGKLASFDGTTIAMNGTLTNTGGANRFNATSGDLSLGANALVTGLSTLDAFGKSITMAATSKIQQSGTVRMTANGDQTKSSGNLALSQVSGGSVDLNANGVVTGVGASNVHLRATAVGGQVRVNTNNIAVAGITKGTGIGSASQALRIAAPNGYAGTLTGDIFLQLDDTTAFTSIATGNGAVTVNATKGFSAQTVSGTGNLSLTASSATAANSINVLTATTASGSLVATAPGTLYFNKVVAPLGIRLTGSNIVTLGSGDTNEDIVLTAAQAITASAANAGKNVSIASTSGAVVVSSAAAKTGTLTATSGGSTVQVGTGTAAKQVTLSGTGLTGTTLTSGTGFDIALTATGGGISYKALTSGQDVSMTARDTISQQSGSLVLAERTITANAGAIAGGAFNAKAGVLSLTASTVDAVATDLRGTNVTVVAARNATLGTVNTAGGLSVSAIGSTSIGNVASAASLTVSSNVNSTVNAGTVVGGASIIAVSGIAALANLSANTISASGGGSLNTSGSLTSATGMVLSSLNGGVTAATLTANGGTLGVTSKLAASVAKATSSGAMTVSGTSLALGDLNTTDAASDIVLTASAGAMTYKRVDAGRNLTATVRDLISNSITTGALLKAGGKMTVSGLGLRGNVVQAGGDIDITATSQDIAADSAIGGSVKMVSARNITLTKIQSLIGQVSLSAVRDVTVQQLQSAGFFGLTAGRNATLGSTAACPASPALPDVYVVNGMNVNVVGTLTLQNPACANIMGGSTIVAGVRVGL